MSPSTHARKQSGMTLIEVLVAVLVLSFGILGLVGLQARAVQYSVATEDVGRASLLANDLISQMWLSNSADLGAVRPAILADWQARVAATLPNGVGTLTVNGALATVTLTWRQPSATSSETDSYTTQVVVPTGTP